MKKTAAPDCSALRLADVFFVDQSYSRKHAHMFHKHAGVLELLYVAAGEGRYLVGRREYAVHEGDLVICNADTLHGEAPFQENTIQTYCCALTGVQSGRLAPGCLIDARERPVLALGGRAEAMHRLMQTIYELFTDAADGRAVCGHLAAGVLLLAWQAVQAHASSAALPMERKNEALVRAITDYLDRNYTGQVTLAETAAAMHISVSRLSHLFKQETGLSPMQYVVHRRIGEAQSLLSETDLPVGAIEERLGFGSSCHLTSMFKKYVGVAPSEYRRHFQKQPKTTV